MVKSSNIEKRRKLLKWIVQAEIKTAPDVLPTRLIRGLTTTLKKEWLQ